MALKPVNSSSIWRGFPICAFPRAWYVLFSSQLMNPRLDVINILINKLRFCWPCMFCESPWAKGCCYDQIGHRLPANPRASWYTIPKEISGWYQTAQICHKIYLPYRNISFRNFTVLNLSGTNCAQTGSCKLLWCQSSPLQAVVR